MYSCSEPYDTKKEAVWALANLTSGGTHEHVALMVDKGALRPLVELLDIRDKYVALTL